MKKLLLVVVVAVSMLAGMASLAFAKTPSGIFENRHPGYGYGDVNHSHYGAPGQL